jgi:hypothetical protein
MLPERVKDKANQFVLNLKIFCVKELFNPSYIHIMRNLTFILYFVLAIVLFASIGVSLPYCFETLKDGKHSIQDLNQNIVTYFIAIFVSASLDYLLKLSDDKGAHRKPVILTVCIVNALIFWMTAYILYENSKGNIKEVSGLAIFGVLASYIMWMVANYKNSTFDVTSTLGGDANKSLSNG